MDDEEDYTESTWTYITLCGEPTIYDGLRFAKDLIIANLSLRFIIQCVPLPHIFRHLVCLVIGVIHMYINIGIGISWIIAFTLTCFVLLVLFTCIITTKYRGLLVSIYAILFLLISEVLLVDSKTWQQIRGIQMIAAMKIISLAIELDRNLFNSILNPVEFFGYIFCPANSILGPWISFHSYNQCLNIRFLAKRRWISIIIMNLIVSMMFLVLSNCIVPWYIDDISVWLEAFRDAQAFRMSHYFVSSMSIVSMVSAGFGLTNDCHLDLDITKPLNIELPRSLVQVVIYWNIPMHQWLKTYVFKSCQPYGKFTAILITYLVSSLLHGFNFQFSAVLLSIGTFSYVEYNLRYKVASALEACCLANPCGKQCEHKFKKNSVLAVFLNTIFSIITVVHLAYLGVMFEASFSVQESGYSYYHIMSKWENLNFFSHIFTGFMYIIYIMM